MNPAWIGRFGRPPREMLTCKIVPATKTFWAKFLNVVVQRELVRMRTQPHGLRLVLPFVVDKRLDQFFGEDVAAEEETVVVFQAGQGFVERGGHRGDTLHLFGREIVDVFI